MTDATPRLADTIGTGGAARYLRVHPDTLLRWCKEGKVRYSLTPSGRHRFTAADLDQLLMREPSRVA